MKKLNCLCVALVLGLFAVGGCKKSSDAPVVPEVNGVKVDFPGFQHSFDGASAELMQSVSEAVSGIRYGQYDKSLMALDKLSNEPSLTPQQKQKTTEMIESVKQLLAKAPPPAQ